MNRPTNISQKKQWLNDNIGPVTVSKRRGTNKYVASFANAACFSDGYSEFPIRTIAESKGAAIKSLFNEVTRIQTRYDHIVLRNNYGIKIQVDPKTLAVNEVTARSFT